MMRELKILWLAKGMSPDETLLNHKENQACNF